MKRSVHHFLGNDDLVIVDVEAWNKALARARNRVEELDKEIPDASPAKT